MTAEEREAMILILASRKKTYKILHDFWINEPGAAQLENLYDPAFGVALDLLTPDDEESLRNTLESLYVEPNEFTEEYFKSVRRDYYNMIAAKGNMPKPPFATKYLPLEQDAILEEMLTVRATYERYGALHTEPSIEAEGYLAMELSFMSRTCGLAQQAVELGVDRRATQLLDEQDWFLNDHLLVWTKRWGEAVRNCGEDNFYTKLAHLTERFLVCDSKGLNDISDLL